MSTINLYLLWSVSLLPVYGWQISCTILKKYKVSYELSFNAGLCVLHQRVIFQLAFFFFFFSIGIPRTFHFLFSLKPETLSLCASIPLIWLTTLKLVSWICFLLHNDELTTVTIQQWFFPYFQNVIHTQHKCMCISFWVVCLLLFCNLSYFIVLFHFFHSSQNKMYFYQIYNVICLKKTQIHCYNISFHLTLFPCSSHSSK